MMGGVREWAYLDLKSHLEVNYHFYYCAVVPKQEGSKVERKTLDLGKAETLRWTDWSQGDSKTD